MSSLVGIWRKRILQKLLVTESPHSVGIMEDENEDMELDFNPFDSTFENFEEFDSQDVESLAKELQFYEQKAEFLAGQGALEGFSFSRDAFSMNQVIFSDDAGNLDAGLEEHRPEKGGNLANIELQFSCETGFRGAPGVLPLLGAKKQAMAGPSKSAEDHSPKRSRSTGSLKRGLSEQAQSGGSGSGEVRSEGVSNFGGLSFGGDMPAVDSHSFDHQIGADEGRQAGIEMHQLGGLQDSLLAALMEPREGEPYGSVDHSNSLFHFKTDSKPFDFGASLFSNPPNGMHSHGSLSEDLGLQGGGDGNKQTAPEGSGSLLEPGLLTPEDANEITKANMWVSSDGDDRPIGALVRYQTLLYVLDF